jgi:threonine aldolase
MTVLDLRSDTVTRPSAGMRRAMAQAEVGDDVLDGDPTTRRLEERVAALLGQETALFFPSGTQANQTAIGLLVPRATELVLEAGGHPIHYEVGAVAALWGVQPRPVAAPDGMLTPELVEAAIRPASPFTPRTGGIVIENTHNLAGGAVMPLATMRAIRAVADRHGLPLHVDGARLWNAAVALGLPLEALGAVGTTVMVSFNKGLGCPVGACLAGPRAWRDEAWGIRKRLGGGMRQSGIVAAAGLYALEHTLPRLHQDHEAARAFYQPLADHPDVRVAPPPTNIVMLDLVREDADPALRRLAEAGVWLIRMGPRRLRAVTHLDVSPADAARAGQIVARVLRNTP